MSTSTLTLAQTLELIYAAFSRGDVDAILALVHPDVEWEYGQAQPVAPFFLPRRGHAGARQFFASLAAMNITKFDVKAILEGPGIAVGVVELEATIPATGKHVREENEIHLFHFDNQGQVTRFRHCVDSLAWANALQP